jgi:apolipoprotein D and lipocalin family protein
MRLPRVLTGFIARYGAAIRYDGCQPLSPVPSVELGKYMGKWHIIAYRENPFETNLLDATDTYVLNDDGSVTITCIWRPEESPSRLKAHCTVGHIVQGSANAIWHVPLFPMIEASYVVMDRDEDYQWAAVGHPSRQFGWILAREPILPYGLYEELMGTFRRQGFDPTRFRLVEFSGYGCATGG